MKNQACPVRSRSRSATVSSNGGFIALMSIIIIAIVLLVMVTSLSMGGYVRRFNILNSEIKKMSSSLAEGCMNTAVLKLSEDWSYAGNETVTVNGQPCQIFSVTTPGADPQTLHTQAVYSKSYTNLEVTVQKNPFVITSWQEMKYCDPVTGACT